MRRLRLGTFTSNGVAEMYRYCSADSTERLAHRPRWLKRSC